MRTFLHNVRDTRRTRDTYRQLFGVTPDFGIGIHGGAVIVSELDDTKRSIGIYRDAINIINIAARMEDAARAYQLSLR